jgi:Zn-dependent protease with chaperone function
MAADPILAAQALLDHIPRAARSLAAARAEADHWRVGSDWAAVGVALILIRQSRLLPRVQERLGAIVGREALSSLLCAVLLVALIEAARTLASALVDAIWSRGALASGITGDILNLPAEALIGGFCLWALLRARRRWPRFGWAGVSLAASVLIFAAVLVPPVTLSPSARGDRPASGPDTAPILAFVRNGGLDAQGLYVFESADPLAVDIEGVGPVAHAAVSRAALARPAPETYAAIGHLLGHHHHKDLYGLAALWSAFFAAFCWAVWMCGRLFERQPDQAAPTSWSGARALPVVGLIGWGGLLLATPTFNVFDQVINYRADDYALSLTHDPDALCRWLMTTEAGGKADPSPLEALFFYDHPPLKNRLINSLRWKAAHP